MQSHATASAPPNKPLLSDLFVFIVFLVSFVIFPSMVSGIKLGQTHEQATTPGRSRFSTFLGNATPSRLRRLAGRIGAKSPGPPGSSQRSSSRHSRSGSSTRSRKHRRQGTFPGAYSQRNSSELDHQRPPADPVYTFMIKVDIVGGEAGMGRRRPCHPWCSKELCFVQDLSVIPLPCCKDSYVFCAALADVLMWFL